MDCFLFLFSMNCFGWGNESVKLLTSFKYPFGNSFVGTVYSTCRADSYEIKDLPGSFQKISIENEFYRVNPMKSHLFKTKKERRERLSLLPVFLVTTPAAFQDKY